jgi:hypothetical protein
MKKVAATSGHNVSFADFWRTVGMARDGTALGKEMLLNFCRFLHGRPPLSPWRSQRDYAIAEYKYLFGAQEKSASQRKNYSKAQWRFGGA